MRRKHYWASQSMYHGAYTKTAAMSRCHDIFCGTLSAPSSRRSDFTDRVAWPSTLPTRSGRSSGKSSTRRRSRSTAASENSAPHESIYYEQEMKRSGKKLSRKKGGDAIDSLKGMPLRTMSFACLVPPRPTHAWRASELTGREKREKSRVYGCFSVCSATNQA